MTEAEPHMADRSSKTTVHVLRHGEVHNPTGILYGRLPGYLLSERGHAMAERVGKVLAERDVAAVVASPLERARQSAQPSADQHDLPVRSDDRLLESTNVFQGKTFGVGDGSLARPSAWWQLRNPFRPSWGEPYEQIACRMRAVLDDVAREVRGREALLISHQLPIWTLRMCVEGRRLWHDPRSRQCALASLTSFTFRGAHVVRVTYSEPAADLLPVAEANRVVSAGPAG